MKLPVAFIPHGGGPWPFVDLGLPRPEVETLAAYLRSVRHLPPQAPRALLVVSGHWEAAAPTVMTSAHPPILYDYFGFPPESYEIAWPAPGAPWLAGRIRDLLSEQGLPSREDPDRGYDHGTFIPLKLTYPDAEIPTIQLSLVEGLSPAEHLAIGRAIAPLRDEGVFIVGSGMTFHNLRAFRNPSAIPAAETFDAWLQRTMTLDSTERDRGLLEWEHAPAARVAHPREDHLIPLMVAAGAAGADRSVVGFSGTFGGMPLSAYHFG
jgi:aromatic ring-opening dioxygenase catalytic subunit (LigB family)